MHMRCGVSWRAVPRVFRIYLSFLLLPLFLLPFLFAVTLAQATVTISQINYQGWAGSYRMTNGTVELVFVPQIGRIMRYGYVGGANMLWNNPTLLGVTPDPKNLGTDWVNYGGDKLWNAPQSVWGWPPDPTLDRGPQTVVTLTNQHLQATGSVSPKFHLHFVRDIALDDTGTGVTLTNTMVNDDTKSAQWSVWEIAQTDSPAQARLPLYKNGHFSQGYSPITAPVASALDLIPTYAVLRRDKTNSAKIGTDSPTGQIIATVHGLDFHLSLTVDNTQTYPDGGCSQEIYTNPDPLPYVEMELLGPLHTLAAGAQTTQVMHWSLSPAPAFDANNDDLPDLLWRNVKTGDVAWWQMNGLQIQSSQTLAMGIPLNWRIAAMGDFNGDGKSDLIWQNTTTGDVAVWYLSNGALLSSLTVAAGIPLEWHVIGSADLNSDGNPDLIWQSSKTGAVTYWLMNGISYLSSGTIQPSMPAAWRLAGTGDFNGDGNPDLVWQNTTTGDVAVWYMNGVNYQSGVYITRAVSREWQLAAIGDFNGDGKPDLIWQNTTTGDIGVWIMNGINYGSSFTISSSVPLSWQIFGTR